MDKLIYKKFFISAFIVFTICILPGKVSADYIVHNGVNIRKGPGTEYSIVTTINRNDTEIKVISAQGDWSQVVLSNGIQGYIKSSFLRQRNYLKVKTPVALRTAPHSSSEIIEHLKTGDLLALIRYGIRDSADEENNHLGWYRVYNLKTGKIGWCSEASVSLLESKNIPYNTVNLRASATTDSSILKVLKKGNHISIIEKNELSGWSKVISNGVIGYVKNNLYSYGGEYTYVTTLTSHYGRNKNIEKASSLINGKIIYSGNVFNYLSYLGEVTQSRWLLQST